MYKLFYFGGELVRFTTSDGGKKKLAMKEIQASFLE